MSVYSPGTILSVGFGSTLEQVIVITENKVATKTFGGKPVERRDIMSMADWLLVIGDQRIQLDYLPVPAAEPQVEAKSEVEPEKTYPVGTKLSWKHPEGADRWYSPNSRTAIVLKDGILQVKEVNNSITVTTHPGAYYAKSARKFFSSLADWKQQLPAGGSMTVTEATEDFSVPSIKRKAQAPVEATTDYDYIKELQQRFSVHAFLEEGQTPAQRLANQVRSTRDQMTLVDSLTTPMVLATTRAPREIAEALEKADIAARRLRRSIKKANAIQRSICAEPSKALKKPFWFVNKYKQRLVAFIKGKEIEICSNPKDGLIALRGDPALGAPYDYFYGIPKTGRTFAELGLDLKADGKPRLKAYYRCEFIEV
jgi:hypothetical protein